MYQPISLPQYNPISGITNALTEARQSMVAQERHRAELLLREKELAQRGEESRANTALANRQQAMREEAMAADLKTKRMEVVTQIGQALDAGRPDAARQIAATHGIKLDEVLGPQHGEGDTLVAPGTYTKPTNPTVTPGAGANPGGMREQGNVNLYTRPSVRNEDGSASSVRSASFNIDGVEVLLPTVSDDGRLLSDDEAVALYRQSKKHLGRFKSPADATAYAGILHDDQEALGERPSDGMVYTPSAPLALKPRARSYSIDGVGYDQEEARLAQQQRLAQAAAQQRRAYEPFGPKYADMAAGVAAGGDPKIAGVIGSAMEHDTARAARAGEAEERREFQAQENEKYRRSFGQAVTLAQIGASGRNATVDLKREAGDRAEESGLDGVVKNVFTTLGYKESRRVQDKYHRMANLLTKPNAASDAVVAGSFVKEAQGGSGVISDADMDAFWNRIGGVTERTHQWVRNVIDGKIAHEKRAIVMQAVSELARYELQKQGEVKDAIKQRLKGSAYESRTDDILATYFPAERSRIDDARAIDRAKNRTRVSRLKGGGSDAIDRDSAELD